MRVDRVALPVGARLEERAGGAVVSRGGVVLARVPAPVARDAEGSVVPVSMRVSGRDLLLSVALRDREVAYPVLVDPTFTLKYEGSKGWTYKGGEGVAWEHGSALSLAGEATFPLAGEVQSSEASLKLGMPESYRFNKVEFLGVGGFIRALGSAEGWNGNVEWKLRACSQGESCSAEAGKSLGRQLSLWNVVVVKVSLAWKCCLRLVVQARRAKTPTVAGEISVASILFTYEPYGLEEEIRRRIPWRG